MLQRLVVQVVGHERGGVFEVVYLLEGQEGGTQARRHELLDAVLVARNEEERVELWVQGREALVEVSHVLDAQLFFVCVGKVVFLGAGRRGGQRGRER